MPASAAGTGALSHRPFTFGGEEFNVDTGQMTYLYIDYGLNEPSFYRGGPHQVDLGGNGRFWRPVVPDFKRVEIRGRVCGVGTTEAERVANFHREMERILNTFVLGEIDDLVVTTEDGEERTIQLETVSIDAPHVDVAWLATVHIVLESVAEFEWEPVEEPDPET